MALNQDHFNIQRCFRLEYYIITSTLNYMVSASIELILFVNLVSLFSYLFRLRNHIVNVGDRKIEW